MIGENRQLIGDANARLAELGKAVYKGDKEKIKEVSLGANQNALALKKDGARIVAESKRGWFSRAVTFIKEEGGALMDFGLEAMGNIVTQNWGGLIGTVTTLASAYLYRKEKAQKQEFATAINDIAHEPDEKVRQEKLRKTFNKRKSDGKV